MPIVRRLLARRHLAVLLCAATLLLRLLVPAGYMLDGAGGRPAVTLCSGMASGTVAMPGLHRGMADHGGSRRHEAAGTSCAFAAVSAVALPAIDPVRLAGPIAFVVALAIAAVALRSPARSARHRPPPRAPPILP